MTPREFAIQVTQRLQEAGHEAFWAGGCVRDQLLGTEPTDYDVATSATPEQIRELFGQRRTLPLGAAFGVITIIGPRSAGNVEVATFRTDGDYSDGRHPDGVTWGSAELDAQRRDFTINGLFFDPLEESVIDYVDGQRDLAAGIVRAIGDPACRFDEDKLRMLRAVRFAATLGFQLDPATFSTIQQKAAEIEVVSVERIASELTRMLQDPCRRRGFELLVSSGLLVVEALLPELAPWVADPDWLARVSDQLDALNEPELPECLAMLLAPLNDRGVAREICTRLRLANEVRDTVLWILKHADTLQAADDLPWSETQPLLVDSRSQNALRFLEARNSATGQSDGGIRFCRHRLTWPAEQLNPPRLIDGQQLKALGIEPGPQYRELLEAVRQKQLDGEIETTDQALAYVRAGF